LPLNEWDNSLVSWHCELEKIQGLIKQRMDGTFKETDKKNRTLLAMLEYKARLIRQSIIRRNRMEN
jgi:hypothetical protein